MFGFKRYIKALVLIISAQVLYIKAQNLVYNGYFEVYSSCPTARSSPSNLQLNYATGWQTSASTPDYYNSCASTSSQVNVPYSGYGYQQDCCGGNGYAGEFMLDMNSPNYDREYIYTKLIDTLKAGHKYLASMYVSRADGWEYAIATIGMLFTDTAIALPYPQSYINATPQVKNTTLLSDTINWILIQDTITAIGNEAYLTIGNFNTSATCDSVYVGGNGTYWNFAYYYIDGVSVYDLATVGIEQLASNKAQVTVYPNPANNKVQVTYTGNSGQISLYDVLGSEVISTQAKEIDVSSLPNGVYFLNAKTAEGVLSKKVIVQR
jgi:type IX secretion system substrate protein